MVVVLDMDATADAPARGQEPDAASVARSGIPGAYLSLGGLFGRPISGLSEGLPVA